jgi:ribosomal protein S27AE
MAEVQILDRVCPKCGATGFYRHDEEEAWMCCDFDCDEIFEEKLKDGEG